VQGVFSQINVDDMSFFLLQAKDEATRNIKPSHRAVARFMPEWVMSPQTAAKIDVAFAQRETIFTRMYKS
jgi:hypothetical protein